MKIEMEVTRTITRKVHMCCECPYYFEERDMSSSLCGCDLLGDLYDAIFKDNSYVFGIYDNCPYNKNSNEQK